MKKYIINGGKKLKGETGISGSKNVVLKAVIAACLTDEEVELSNIPKISDFYTLLDLVKRIGATVRLVDHRVAIKLSKIKENSIPIEAGAKIRTSSMLLSPLLLRAHSAVIPNPGGCRIGARPIDWHIKGLEKMGARIKYNSRDGYFYATVNGLVGTTFRFKKNTHTGTETLILAGVCAQGRTVLENAAQEPEIDDLIKLLNAMGARIRRENPRSIIIDGVRKLHGAHYRIMQDRNELVTFALASALTGGGIVIKNAGLTHVSSFLEKFKEVGGAWEEKDSTVRFYLKSRVFPTDIITSSYPGFMTDWQGPWAVLMTQADGTSTIHETIYENRFGYIEELNKMGAEMSLYNPKVEHPLSFYNFNYDHVNRRYKHAVKIFGKTPLHNAVLAMSDLRAGATLVLSALIAKGESIIFGIEHLDRGYENFDKRLKALGANIKVVEDTVGIT